MGVSPLSLFGHAVTQIKAIAWVNGRVRLLDQTRLPQEEVYLDIGNYRELAQAIREMKVRGAPALGVAGAYALALAAQALNASSRQEFLARLGAVAEEVATTRPTA